MEKPVAALGEGPRGLPNVILRQDELDEASQRLRANFRLEIDANWRHIGACERFLKLCTTLDPRYKLALWSEEESVAVTQEVIAMGASMLVAGGLPSPPEAKMKRVLKAEGSFDDFFADMQGMQSASSSRAALPVRTPEKQARSDVKTAFRLYLDGPSCPADLDPYTWWSKQDPDSFGALFPLARRLLAVPASNADVEFSGARRVLNFMRQSMDPSPADRALRLHYNMHGLRLWEPAPQSVNVGVEEK